MSKLIAIQKDLKVLKTEINSFGGYNYRTTEGIMLALKPLLVKHECELIMSDKLHAMNEHVYVEATATMECEGKTYHASSFARDAIVKKGMSSDQITNSASSFARKQCLSGMFLLDDTATPIASKEEQEEQEKEISEEKEKQEALQQEQIDTFIADSKAAIEGSLSIEELQSIYKVLWRESHKLALTDEIETMYRNKRDAV